MPSLSRRRLEIRRVDCGCSWQPASHSSGNAKYGVDYLRKNKPQQAQCLNRLGDSMPFTRIDTTRHGAIHGDNRLREYTDVQHKKKKQQATSTWQLPKKTLQGASQHTSITTTHETLTRHRPSEIACLASSPGRMSRTAVWISREEMVDFLEYAASSATTLLESPRHNQHGRETH